MRIDPEDLRRQYAELTDEALLALDRAELVEVAQKVYDEEVARRALTRRQETESLGEADEVAGVVADGGDELDIDTDAAPDWLEGAACACAFQLQPGATHVDAAIDARAALRAAGIPCHLAMTEADAEGASGIQRPLCNVMVPGALSLHAASVLDREMFNQEQEDAWRAQFEMLSDEELRALDPKIFCAGLLDKVARLKRAYEEEIAHRG